MITLREKVDFGRGPSGRQRIKPAMTEGAFRICPHCQGAGQITASSSSIPLMDSGNHSERRIQFSRAAASMAPEVRATSRPLRKTTRVGMLRIP